MTVSKTPRGGRGNRIAVILMSCSLIAAVIALILSQTVLLRPHADGGEVEPPDEQERPLMTDFALPRAAVGGVNCVGGSAADRPIASYTLGDLTYTVGETDSRDLDATGAPGGRNLFVAVSDAQNTVRRVDVFGTSADDTAVAAALAADGIQILSETDAKADNLLLYTYAYADGDVSDVKVPSLSRLSGRSLLALGSRVYLFADNYSAGTDMHTLLVYCFEGGNVRFVHTVTDTAVSYEFAAAYPAYEGCTVFANAREGNYTYPVRIAVGDLDYTLAPLLRYEANTRLISTCPAENGFRLLLATEAGSRLAALSPAGTVRTLAEYPTRGDGAVLPFRKKDCVVFFSAQSVCYLSAGGRTETREFDDEIADARLSGDTVELLLRGERAVRVFELGNAVTAAAAVRLTTAKFGNSRFIYGTMRAGMGDLDAALVRPSEAV